MNRIKKLGLGLPLIVSLSAFAATHTHAQQDSNAQGWYLGAGAGVADPLLEGLDKGNSANVYGGLQIADQIYLEAGGLILGEFESEADPDDSVELTALTVALRAENRINDHAAVYAKLGGMRYELEPTVSVGGTNVDVGTRSGMNFWAGFGAAWYIGDNIALWLQADHFYQVDDININSVSAGLQIGF